MAPLIKGLYWAIYESSTSRCRSFSNVVARVVAADYEDGVVKRGRAVHRQFREAKRAALERANVRRDRVVRRVEDCHVLHEGAAPAEQHHAVAETAVRSTHGHFLRRSFALARR